MFYVIINKAGLYFDFSNNNWTSNLDDAMIVHYDEDKDVTNERYFFLGDCSEDYSTILHPKHKLLSCC